MFSISPYKLNMYLECPRHYWWNYINPSTRSLPQIKPYFTMGDHVHNALKHFFNLELDQRTKPVLLQLLSDHWRLKSGRDGGFWTPEIEHEYRDRANLMLSAFADREDITVKPIWASDKNIKVPISETLDFLGRIDRVDATPEGLHIIDYKTSREEREDEWQLPMYAVLARRYFKQPVAKLSYLFLETGSWLSVPANPARESFTVSRVQQIVDSMPHSLDRASWVCPDGDECQHCNYLKEVGLDPLGDIVQLPTPIEVTV